MIDAIDLPQIKYKKNGKCIVLHAMGLPEFLVEKTAHVVTDDRHRHTCHKCQEKVNTFVQKPRSPFVWCLRCW